MKGSKLLWAPQLEWGLLRLPFGSVPPASSGGDPSVRGPPSRPGDRNPLDDRIPGLQFRTPSDGLPGIQCMLREELQQLAKRFTSRKRRTPYEPVDLCETNLRIDRAGLFTFLRVGV